MQENALPRPPISLEHQKRLINTLQEHNRVRDIVERRLDNFINNMFGSS